MQKTYAIWLLLEGCIVLISAQNNPKNVRLSEVRIMDSSRPVSAWYIELHSLNSGPSSLMGYQLLIISGSQIEVNNAVLFTTAHFLTETSCGQIG